MHIHLGFIHLIAGFIGSVILVGTLWRIATFILVGADSVVLNDIGKAMSFMY